MTPIAQPARLHRITGRVGMCGPCAMSAVTGLPTHDCAAILRDVTGRTQIHGVREHELAAAMLHARWRCEHTIHPGSGRPTLAAWLRDHDTFANPYILVVRNHYIALAGGEVADSGWMFRRKPQPVDTAACAYVRRSPANRAGKPANPRAMAPRPSRPPAVVC